MSSQEGRVVDWGNIKESSANSKSNDNFLRVKSGVRKGDIFKVRPISKPIEIHRYYVKGADGKTRSAITKDPDNCIIRQKYNVDPVVRYAINVLDRDDNNTLKILETAPSVLRPMKAWGEMTGKSPGGKDGCDFAIKVVPGPGGDKRRTRYEVTPINSTTLTSEEVAKIKEQDGPFDLEKIFKPTPQDKIESILYPESASSSGGSNDNDDDMVDDSDSNDFDF